MIESNTQGHGAIKKLRTGAVVSTLALTAFGVSTGVSASEVEVAVNEPATKVVAQDEVKPKIPSQEDVDKAKAESDKANQDVAKQKELVKISESHLADNEKSIAEITKKIKEEAKSVTPEKVAEAKADADKKASELATAEKTVADTDKSVAATAEKVANQSKVVANADKTATATANKVADAQKKVDALSSTTDVAPLEKEVATLTNQVKADSQAVETAQTNLDNGKKAQAKKDQAIKGAQSGVSQAESNLSQATTALDNAKKIEIFTVNEFTNAQSTLKDAKDKYNSLTGNVLKVHTEYNNLLKQYLAKPTKELSNQLSTLGRQIMETDWGIPKNDSLTDMNTVEKLKYVEFSKKDQEKIIDIKNLSSEDKLELAKYIATLVSDVRRSLNTGELVIDDDVMKLSQRITELTRDTHFIGHDILAIENASSEVAARKSYQDANGTFHIYSGSLVSENEAFPVYSGTLTMAKLKKKLLYQTLGIVYADASSDWEHTDTLLYSDRSFGIAFNEKAMPDYPEYKIIEYRFNVLPDLLRKFTNFNGIKHEINFSKESEKAKTNLDSAQLSYDKILSDKTKAKSDVGIAQLTYETALQNFKISQKQLSDLRSVKITDVPSLEKALADAESKLAEDTKALQTAKESLARAKSNATEKAKTLAEAKTTLEIAKAEQATADKALTTAKGELEVLTKAHDVAVLARKSAGQDLARKREASKEATDTHTVLELALTKRGEVLKALNKELTDAKSKLGVLRAELETAKEELARLEGIAEAKARGYENFKQLKAEHDAYLAEQQRLQALKDKEDAIRKAGGQPKEVTDASGKVVDIVDAKARVLTNLKDLKDHHDTELAEQKRLEDLSRKADAIRKADGQPKEVTNASGKVVDVVDTKVQNKPVSVATVGTKDDKTYQAPAKATNAKAEPKKQLPNTGEKRTNTVTLAIITALSSIGLVYRKRKKSQ